MVLPDPLPFAGVEFEPRQSMKYRSEIDIQSLVEAANKELREDHREAYKTSEHYTDSAARVTPGIGHLLTR